MPRSLPRVSGRRRRCAAASRKPISGIRNTLPYPSCIVRASSPKSRYHLTKIFVVVVMDNDNQIRRLLDEKGQSLKPLSRELILDEKLTSKSFEAPDCKRIFALMFNTNLDSNKKVLC